LFPHGGNDDDERSDNDSIDNGVIEKNVKAGETRDGVTFLIYLYFYPFILKIISTVFNIPTGAYTSIPTSGGMLGLYHILC